MEAWIKRKGWEREVFDISPCLVFGKKKKLESF
jgi:hypothetical protein